MRNSERSRLEEIWELRVDGDRRDRRRLETEEVNRAIMSVGKERGEGEDTR